MNSDKNPIPVSLPARMRGLPPYILGQINTLRHKKRMAGLDILDLGMGNPNDPTPEPVIERLVETIHDKRNHRYSDAAGIFNLRKEVADRYKRQYGVDLDPETEVVCTIGSKEGFSHLCLALLEQGDTVISPNPCYPIHRYAPLIAGATVLTVSLTTPEQILRDLNDVCARVHPRPKLIVLNFPHNPTTMCVDAPFFEEAIRIARRFGSMLIHDFAYGATTFDGYKPPSFLATPGAKEVGVEFTTMSKEFNMAGWRVGFCAGHREMIAALKRIKGYFDYGMFQSVQIAAIVALRECAADSEKQALVYQRRRDVLCDGLARIGWPVVKPKASMFAWVAVPEPYRAMGSVEFAIQLVEQAEVAVAPGVAFGEEGEGFLRFALVENEQRLKQAVRQMGRAFPGNGK